ncbi:MAG: hypothetical protein GX306_08270 [Clostridiales bacterium]|jgi:hypothetical protein|nr:hypothetical protein [Clostridiales bacterium]
MGLAIIILTLLFAIWLQYQIRKSNKINKQSMESFWHREIQSNQTRRVNISNLDYITVSLERLPMDDHEDPTINSYRDIIYDLSNKKILNLTGMTNTELKFKYGAANIKLLSEYDNNYTKLVSMLHKWGERLYAHGNLEEAILVLEYAISCFTDVSKTYKLLATIYKDQNTPDKINSLIDFIPLVKTLRKEDLINELKRIKDS